MNRNIILIALLFTALGMSACCKRRAYCRTGSLSIAFVGFQTSEIRSFVLRRYDIDDTIRTKALDSAQFVYTGTASLPNVRDTVWMSDYNSNGKLGSIHSGNDWTITFVSIGRQYGFHAIYDEEHRYDIVRCSDNETSCTNRISHFSINGAWNEGDVAFIFK